MAKPTPTLKLIELLDLDVAEGLDLLEDEVDLWKTINQTKISPPKYETKTELGLVQFNNPYMNQIVSQFAEKICSRLSARMTKEKIQTWIYALKEDTLKKGRKLNEEDPLLSLERTVVNHPDLKFTSSLVCNVILGWRFPGKLVSDKTREYKIPNSDPENIPDDYSFKKSVKNDFPFISAGSDLDSIDDVTRFHTNVDDLASNVDLLKGRALNNPYQSISRPPKSLSNGDPSGNSSMNATRENNFDK